MSDTQVWFVLICGVLVIFGLGGGWLAFVAWLRWTDWQKRAEERAERLALLKANGGVMSGLLGGSDAAEATREKILEGREMKAAEAQVQRGRRG